MDDTDRLTRAQQGTWGGSSIASETEDQTRTLSHTGNWDAVTLDFDANNVYTGTDEYDDSRSHNDVNELTGRDTDSDSTDNFTHVYDEVGNMTDDGESRKYEYDAFGRMRRVRNQSDALIAEYRYNGLGFLISEHADTDDDGDVDASDKWFHNAYDERWRKVATYRETDSDPKEEFINHQAGLGGNGGSSYINAVVSRDKDANTAWTSASDGVLEDKIYYCQNWRGDVSAIVSAAGWMKEWAKYSSCGVPFGLPGADTDSDGDCDATDVVQIQTWIDAPAYDVRGDIDLDGDVDATDKSTVQTYVQGATAGRGAPSALVGNRRGYAGYTVDANGLWHVRHRVLDSGLGRWLRRDPLGYVDGPSVYENVGSNPLIWTDPRGLGKVGVIRWLVQKVGGSLVKVKKVSKQTAIGARKVGKNIKVEAKSSGVAMREGKSIESAAANGGQILKHKPHKPGYLPHYQTAGVPGHTFYGTFKEAAGLLTATHWLGEDVGGIVDLVNPLALTRDLCDLWDWACESDPPEGIPGPDPGTCPPGTVWNGALGNCEVCDSFHPGWNAEAQDCSSSFADSLSLADLDLVF